MPLYFDEYEVVTNVVGGDGIAYKGTKPIKVSNDVITLSIDNQLLRVTADGLLTVNLDEIGSELIDKANTDLSNLSATGEAKLGSGKSSYGIRGDYATQYGILECPNGILTVKGMDVILKQGVVMQCAGQDIKTLISGDMKHTITSTDDIDLFYAGGQLLECGEVYYQEAEPENGVSNYIAWWKPSLGKWQFKSNDTGNVFRSIVACKIAHIHTNGETITRVDYIGNRILDDEIFALKSDVYSKEEIDAKLQEIKDMLGV